MPAPCMAGLLFVYLIDLKINIMKSINPYNNQLIKEYPEMSALDVNEIIDKNYEAFQQWRAFSFSTRKEKMLLAGEILRNRREEFARLITLEMGKRIVESRLEIDKCAWVCEYYAANAESMLKDELIESDAQKSMAVFQPLGPVLAVMPWNFPFWQVFRFAAPALMAGNSALLKHASNVQGCALAIESVFEEAGFPEDLFRVLVISSSSVEQVIANDKVRAVTLTGSESAGSAVASVAGKHLKKTVLELGGSDPFIILEDADIENTVKNAVGARMICSGQSCICAKRFIVHRSVAEPFISQMKKAMELYTPGDPMDEKTLLAPLAKKEFVEEIDKQVNESIQLGASLITGGSPLIAKGFYYPPTILTDVKPEMPVYHQETFGPVAAVIVVNDEAEAVRHANNSSFGLGASVWTNDPEKGEKLAREIESGCVFINGIVKSDPRLPFGGIKNSGYGRELSDYGIKEFVNIKTVWIR
jgi:succinate-semialdehyde dehydrogenase / glutarate-semialdehyde dehydrogenase